MNAVQPNWRLLLRTARSLIRQVSSNEAVAIPWSLGGGTAMMLQINHRESDDVDIFISDAQHLSFFDPKLHDFKLDILPSDYDGDGSRFLKLAFAGVGEIDFIVGGPLTPEPANDVIIDGETLRLESLGEIIAKKIHFRAASLRPRDIFDIASAVQYNQDAVAGGLQGRKHDVAAALTTLNALRPNFVRAAIAELAIKDGYRPLASTALERARAFLQSL